MEQSNMSQHRIALDLSDDPIQEMLLVTVLSEMVRAVTVESQNTSLTSGQDFTRSDPEHGSKQVEVALHP